MIKCYLFCKMGKSFNEWRVINKATLDSFDVYPSMPLLMKPSMSFQKLKPPFPLPSVQHILKSPNILLQTPTSKSDSQNPTLTIIPPQIENSIITSNKITACPSRGCFPAVQRLMQVLVRSKCVCPIGLQQILYQYLLQRMNCMRELPNEYLDLCPIIDEKYRVVFKLGFGRFSKVRMAINMATNERVAVKILNEKIEQSDVERGYEQRVLQVFLNEVRMSVQAKHRNIVQIIDFNLAGLYRTADGKLQRILYYVMKIEEYGELFRLINQTEQFSERTARHIFRQLLSAMRHIHSRRIAHCDIKSENVLLDSKFNVKVVDFGYARYFQDEHSLPITYDVCDAVGSIKCNAPELTNKLAKEYQAQSIDIFAAGCFLFELVMKAEPFKSSDMKDEHYSKLVNSQKKKFWQIFNSKTNPSLEFKDLIEKMLNPNPKERVTLNALMKHPWVNGETISRDEYRKEMNTRVKKVMVKVRKEQETEIKQIFMKEKGKKELFNLEPFPISIPREYEEKFMQLKSLLAADDRSSSHSDCSSQEEVKQAKVENLAKKVSEGGREREEQLRKE